MIHIVFQQNDIDTLKAAMALDDALQGEVVMIADDFAVGPIANIYTEQGREERRQWMREMLAGGDYNGIVDDGSVPDDNETVAKLKSRLDENGKESLWIWAAQNKHDVSGYYWLISQLKEYQGRIFILYLNNLPFINEKGNIFYPVNLFNIPPSEFRKAKKLARPITTGEFEVDADEWAKLCSEQKGVRILEGGKKLVQYDYNFYDAEIKKFLTGDWIRGHKLIHQVLVKGKHTTGDAYLLWRIKQMAAAGDIEVQGELKNMKDFEVKAIQQETVSNEIQN